MSESSANAEHVKSSPASGVGAPHDAAQSEQSAEEQKSGGWSWSSLVPRSPFKSIAKAVGNLGADVLSVAVGKLVDENLKPVKDDATAEDEQASAAKASERDALVARAKASAAKTVVDKLRGAADDYIAAKLDEIELRVDAKLEEINSQIDQKTEALLDQLRELRDRELRHRLRLLKITLIFTVIIAALSLGYRWLVVWLNSGG